MKYHFDVENDYISDNSIESNEGKIVDIETEQHKTKELIEEIIYDMWENVMKNDCDFNKFRNFIINNNKKLKYILLNS
jgi:predicted urease superfamily metal-dependent hydrolase